MVTSKEILEATPLADEFRRYGWIEGFREGWREGFREGRQQEMLATIQTVLDIRDPGTQTPKWLTSTCDLALLWQILRACVVAPDAAAIRAVLSNPAPR